MTARLLPVRCSLRSRAALSLVEQVLERIHRRSDFGVVHLSVQRNHVHFLIEARDERALSSGMNGLLSLLARRLNRLWGRRGRLWHGRYHAAIKRTPSEVRHAIAYLFRNGLKHGAVPPGQLDPASTVGTFLRRPAPCFPDHCLSRAITWLLRTGWRRAGPLTPRTLTTPP